jgi:hypothetical protein
MSRFDEQTAGQRTLAWKMHRKRAMRLHVLTCDPKLLKDLKILALFVETFCRCKHAADEKSPLRLKTHDLTHIAGREVRLCPSCAKLLTHAIVKRSHCPMSPKPWCKHCPNHCYYPTYRAQIRQVMKYSGIRLLFTGRLHYLAHLLF